MKKIKLFIALFISAFLLRSLPTYAAANLVASSSNVTPGSSFEVSLQIDAAAAWNVHISSSGPAENCSLVDADVTEDARNTAKTFTANCTATGLGTITVSVSGDYTTEDSVTTTLSGSIDITVAEEQPNTGEDPTDEPIDEPVEEPVDDKPTDGGSSDDKNPAPDKSSSPNTGAHGINGSMQEIGIIILSATALTAVIAVITFSKRRHNK